VTIVLDLTRLNHVVSIDEIGMTAVVEAGILGPDLERELNRRDLTLGHLPESFEFSTLGGWIATRGAGLHSSRFGDIAHMTQSVRSSHRVGLLTLLKILRRRSFAVAALDRKRRRARRHYACDDART